MTNVGYDVVDFLRRITPERQENSDIYGHRLDAWEKYGEQPYLVRKSEYPSVRQYGSTIRQGWAVPARDFSGSARNRIQLNLRLTNLADHAPLVLLNEYKQESWEIPGKDGLYGGRKAMMWQGRNGKPVFRWVHTRTRGEGTNVGPVEVKKPATARLGWVLTEAENFMSTKNEEVVSRHKILCFG